jgi:succinyl-CoA synthetase alpha subunit
MASGLVIRRNEYYDSVFLMGINKRLSEITGVEQTAVLMATEANKKLLGELGFSDFDIEGAKPTDLVVAVIADSSETVAVVTESLDELLKSMSSGLSESGLQTLDEALHRRPDGNMVVISIPGEFVSREARKALEAGLNTFVFSSNVPVEQELELKRLANSQGLLLMGPDCGTSIIHGVGIGFANKVQPGPIGVVGPSGTGLQEFTSLIHNSGGGISHAIGTGSRDLSDEIGGLTTFTALQMLEDDPDTHVLAIVAKPPGEQTLRRLLEQTLSLSKPLVGCFLGIDLASWDEEGAIAWARTIDDAVQIALKLSGFDMNAEASEEEPVTSVRVEEEISEWANDARYLRGIFAGGTFCYQSQQIFRDAGLDVYSNGPIDERYRLADADESREHTVVDMGDEQYTLGKPHPMIDSTERAKRILVEARDPEVAVLLLDFILGFNTASDPVGDVLDAIQQARKIRRRIGGGLTIVASVCGTSEDPQDLELQTQLLREQGVVVFKSNARATQFCVDLMRARGGHHGE